jgi:hypothetical protein
MKGINLEKKEKIIMSTIIATGHLGDEIKDWEIAYNETFKYFEELDDYTNEILKLKYIDGFSAAEIVKILEEKYNYYLSYVTIFRREKRFINKMKQIKMKQNIINRKK